MPSAISRRLGINRIQDTKTRQEAWESDLGKTGLLDPILRFIRIYNISVKILSKSTLVNHKSTLLNSMRKSS